MFWSRFLFFAPALLSAVALTPPLAAQPFRADVPSEARPAKTLETKPTPNPELRGDVFMARKMFREAVDAYGTGPDNSAVLANKTGIAYHQLMQLDLAQKQYQRAVKLKPDYAEAINNLGTVAYAQKKYRRATSLYKKAIKLSPQSPGMLSNLGTAYFARKMYKDAADYYQQALALDPEVFEHRGGQGVLLQERSVEERAKFHFYLAKTYAQAGMTERALLYIRKALEEGFRERDQFKTAPEFASLQKMPEFQELLTLEPKVL